MVFVRSQHYPKNPKAQAAAKLQGPAIGNMARKGISSDLSAPPRPKQGVACLGVKCIKLGEKCKTVCAMKAANAALTAT